MRYLLFVINAIVIALFVLFFNSFPPEIPVFYSYGWGEKQLGSMWMLLMPLVLTNFFVLTTGALKKRVFFGSPFLIKLIDWSSVVCILVGFGAFLRMFLLII